VFTALGETDGASNVYLGESSIDKIISRSIFEFMTSSDINNIRTNVGVEVNVDYALQAAVNSGVTCLKYEWVKGVYVHGNTVTLPVGFNIFSDGCFRPYVVSSDASFNNCGVVIRLKYGAPGMFILSGRHTFTNIIFDGRDQTVGMMNAASQVSGCRFECCGSYRWSRGFGRSTGYVATLYVRGCNASSNINAFYNLIDSSVIDSVANANSSHAVNLQTGANNNSFVRTRVEWNDGYGLISNGATGNIFTGEMIDRNGLAGVCCLSGGNWNTTTAIVRRNGRLAGVGSADNCHYRIEGDGSSVIISAVRTAAGGDDGGGGVVTPEYSIVTTGASSNMSVIVGDSLMNGYTIDGLRQVIIADNKNIINNNGLNNIVTTGISQHANGSSYIGKNPGTMSLSIAGTLTFTHNQVLLNTFSQPVRRVIQIYARNITLNTAEHFRFNVLISRVGSGNAIISATGTTEGSSNWALSTASPTGVSVSFSVSSDGSTVTISLTGLDSSSRSISSQLKDA
jgi:hypothetical protein